MQTLTVVEGFYQWQFPMFQPPVFGQGHTLCFVPQYYICVGTLSQQASPQTCYPCPQVVPSCVANQPQPHPGDLEMQAWTDQDQPVDVRMQEDNVMERVVAQLQRGGNAEQWAFGVIKENILKWSTDPQGCRVVQFALQKAEGSNRTMLVEALHDHVDSLMGSPHANYVLQRVVELMPVAVAKFIPGELAAVAIRACKNRYGCRIVNRMIEHMLTEECMSMLMQEVLRSIQPLSKHRWGHYVVKQLLEYGDGSHKHTIARELMQDVQRIAMNKQGSSVMEVALQACADDDKAMLIAKLLESDRLSKLAMDQYGKFVLRTLAVMPCADGTAAQLRLQAVEKLRGARRQVRKDSHFKQLKKMLRDAGLEM